MKIDVVKYEVRDYQIDENTCNVIFDTSFEKERVSLWYEILRQYN